MRNLPISAFPPSINNPTAKVFQNRLHISWGYSFMEFQARGISQKILHALKYQNAKDILPPLFKNLNFYDQNPNLSKPNCIIPVPLHPAKLAQRGYNQAEIIANAIESKLDCPVNNQAVIRNYNNSSQTTKTRLQRHQNSKNLFELQQDVGKHVLIVDDVITSGATIQSMMDAFPSTTEFSIFTLARA